MTTASSLVSSRTTLSPSVGKSVDFTKRRSDKQGAAAWVPNPAGPAPRATDRAVQARRRPDVQLDLRSPPASLETGCPGRVHGEAQTRRPHPAERSSVSSAPGRNSGDPHPQLAPRSRSGLPAARAPPPRCCQGAPQAPRPCPPRPALRAARPGPAAAAAAAATAMPAAGLETSPPPAGLTSAVKRRQRATFPGPSAAAASGLKIGLGSAPCPPRAPWPAAAAAPASPPLSPHVRPRRRSWVRPAVPQPNNVQLHWPARAAAV
jgi:hypothetical protein